MRPLCDLSLIITLFCCFFMVEDCLSGFICNKIDSNEISEQDLKCPLPNCICFLSHPTIRGCTEGLGKSDIYEKFLTFATDKYLQETIEAGAALRCPNETCNYVFQWRPDGSSTAFKCDKCSNEYCLNCSLVEGEGASIGPGHAPLTCAQQREKMEKDEEERRKFEEWKRLNESAAELFENMVQSSGWKRTYISSYLCNRSCCEISQSSLLILSRLLFLVGCPSCKCVIERTKGNTIC